jgi:hypothetical protein
MQGLEGQSHGLQDSSIPAVTLQTENNKPVKRAKPLAKI